jgi:hypothetical protein
MPSKSFRKLITMYFKHQVLLNKLAIGFQEQEPLTFAMGDRQCTSVTIRPLTIEEKEKHKGQFLVCIAFTEEEPSSSVHAIFERLANNLMPEDFKNLKEKQEIIDAEGRIKENHTPSLSLFPKQFQEFASQLHHKLNESIRKAAGVIRWRRALTSSHNAIASTLGVSWSFDNQRWRGMPREIYADIQAEFYFKVSARLHGEIEVLLKTGENEPLGHELFLEAWELRSRNPRSALIIGMSAAEVGLKQCIAKLVPDAEWLANNAPTPPLDKMLSNYLLLLPAKLKIEGNVLKPSQRIRSAIRKGIQARNHSVHVGSEPPKGKALKELLLSIRDLLYLLDFYCGFEWALEYIRDEVREEMVKEFGLMSTAPYSLINLS